MSVAAVDEKERKLKWLLRPVEWAGHVATIGGLTCLVMLTDDAIEWSMIAILASGSLVACSVLLVWGVRRITDVAREL